MGIPIGRATAGLIAFLPLSGILLNGTVTLESLNELEDFIDAHLFIDLSSTSLAAAAFLYFLSDRFGDERRKASDLGDDVRSANARRKEQNMQGAAQFFALAFVICVSGIVAAFGLDQIFQAKFSMPSGAEASHLTLLEAMAGNIPASAEISGGSIALAAIVLLFARGALKLLGTFSSAQNDVRSR